MSRSPDGWPSQTWPARGASAPLGEWEAGLKIEDLNVVRETNDRMKRTAEFLERVEAGKFDVRSCGYDIALPNTHTDAIKALIVSGLRQQIADCRKVLTDRGVVLPEA